MIAILAGLVIQGAGSHPPQRLEVEGVDRQRYQVPVPGHPATVLIFIAHDCPICNQYAPEIARIAKDYGPKGIAIRIVYVETMSSHDLAEHTKEYHLPVPALRDPKGELSRWVQATTTPEAVLLDSKLKIHYRGRIDNRFASLGVKRGTTTTHELRSAIEQFLSHKPVTVKWVPAVGCAIPIY